jgi:hypothetical protein
MAANQEPLAAKNRRQPPVSEGRPIKKGYIGAEIARADGAAATVH